MLEFSKYHGEGNDIIVLNAIAWEITLTPDERRRMCDRKYGVGADGIIILNYNNEGVLNIDYFNANGEIGSLCGNGSRCGLAFAHRIGLLENNAISFIAYDGEHSGRYIPEDDTYGVIFHNIAIDDVEKIDKENYFVNTGSPHHVRFVDHLNDCDVMTEGRQLRYGRYGVANGANVNFVEIDAFENIRVRTYERGVEDETNACGTGAVAVALVYSLRRICNVGRTIKETNTHVSLDILMGAGMLVVKFDIRDYSFSNIELIGKAIHVFDGKYFPR